MILNGQWIDNLKRQKREPGRVGKTRILPLTAAARIPDRN